MDKSSSYNCLDGRSYDVKMSWNENFKDSDHIFSIKFSASDKKTGKPLTMPKEIATYAIGDPQETMGERVVHYYSGDRENLMSDYLTSAYRRVCDWIERGK